MILATRSHKYITNKHVLSTKKNLSGVSFSLSDRLERIRGIQNRVAGNVLRMQQSVRQSTNVAQELSRAFPPSTRANHERRGRGRPYAMLGF